MRKIVPASREIYSSERVLLQIQSESHYDIDFLPNANRPHRVTVHSFKMEVSGRRGKGLPLSISQHPATRRQAFFPN